MLKLFTIPIILVSLFFASSSQALAPQQGLYICEEITQSTANRVVPVINSIQANQILFIHINTPGGSVEAGTEITDAMHHCKGIIVNILEGEAASMGFNILIAGDFVKINHYSLILIHAAYINIGGLFILHSGFGLAQIHEQQKKDYKGYLTSTEEDKIFIKWEDLILTPKDFMSRVQSLLVHMKPLSGSIVYGSSNICPVTTRSNATRKSSYGFGLRFGVSASFS